MTDEFYADDSLRRILRSVRVIAMVGVSANTARPSWLVFKYLLGRGYRMLGVNPGLAGTPLLGQPVYGRLADIPEPVDMVDIFRGAEAAAGVADEALALLPPPKVIWMQLTVQNDVAAAKARAQGVEVVMNRCPKIEYGRLSGEIGWTGVNTGILSSKRPRLAKGFQKLTLDKA